MMVNLFSPFDPSTSFYIPLNLLSTIMLILLIPSSFWLIPNRSLSLWNKILITLHKEFKVLPGPKSWGSTLLFVSLFSIILYNNFLGLFPYIFTSTTAGMKEQ